jgi:hypothetical protein
VSPQLSQIGFSFLLKRFSRYALSLSDPPALIPSDMTVRRGLIPSGCTILFGLLSWILAAVAISSQVWWQFEMKSSSSTTPITMKFSLTKYEGCSSGTCNSYSYDSSQAGFAKQSTVSSFMHGMNDLARACFALLFLAFILQVTALVLLLMKRFRASYYTVIPMLMFSVAGLFVVSVSTFRFRSSFVPSCFCSGVMPAGLFDGFFKICSDKVFQGDESVSMYGKKLSITYGPSSGWSAELTSFIFGCGLLISVIVCFFSVRHAYKESLTSTYQPQSDTPVASYYAYAPTTEPSGAKPGPYASPMAHQPRGQQPQYSNSYVPPEVPSGTRSNDQYSNV